MTDNARNLIAATFPTPDAGSRAAAAVGGAFPDKIGNAAVLFVKPDGTAKFVESKDWGAGRGALLGGAIGIIGGPLGILAGGSIGALTSKLRDSGFKNDQLERLGTSLAPNNSAVVDRDRRRRRGCRQAAARAARSTGDRRAGRGLERRHAVRRRR